MPIRSARQALAFSHRAKDAHSGIVNGLPAILVTPYGRLATVMTFTITNDKIVAIDVIADARRLGQLTIESPMQGDSSGPCGTLTTTFDGRDVSRDHRDLPADTDLAHTRPAVLAIESCARGELNPHVLADTRT